MSFAVIFLFILIIVYIFLLRPRQLRWGATPEEAAAAMEGDNIVSQPHFIATRAVTIRAPAGEVWKWIVQIGSGRAGWYSIDLLDNGGKPSSVEILPQFQIIENGYFIPFTPDQKNGMWVRSFSEHRYILWEDKKDSSTWLWQLNPLENGDTRLITRLRTRYAFSFPWILYYLLYDFGDIIMMRKCLLGIKRRAENLHARSASPSVSEMIP